ncbi:MAG: hypothetical protein ACP5SD_00250 [Elusimicrobiales bacterium]
MILANQTIIYRNIFPYKFLNSEAEKKLIEIKEKTAEIILSKKIIKKPKILINPAEIKDELTVRFLELDSREIKKHSILISESLEETAVGLNLYEHIASISKSSTNDPLESYQRAKRIIDELSKHTIFSYSKNFGFLGSDPTLIPNQTEIIFLIHSPGIYYTNSSAEIKENLKFLGAEIKGINEDIVCSFGFVYMIAKPEPKEKIDDFIKRAKKLASILDEKELKISEDYIKKNKLKFEDTVWKSYGILKYSKIISYDEFISLSSRLAWGISNKTIPLDYEETIEKIIKTIKIFKRKKNEKKKILIAKKAKELTD